MVTLPFLRYGAGDHAAGTVIQDQDIPRMNLMWF
jgi:hypothetical protein